MFQLLDLGSQQPLLVGELASSTTSLLLLAAQLGQAITGQGGGLLQLAQGATAGLELADKVLLLA
ncbi:hypothetical protein D3C84_757240 [compost metagenome]